VGCCGHAPHASPRCTEEFSSSCNTPPPTHDIKDMSDIKNLKDACEALNAARHYQPEPANNHRMLAIILTVLAALAVTALMLL
jgi:hypothetical protein